MTESFAAAAAPVAAYPDR